MEFQRRLLPIPTQSFFLFGPRGTGKSTWLRHLFPEALFVDLLQPDIYREMSARPEGCNRAIPNPNRLIKSFAYQIKHWLKNIILLYSPGSHANALDTGP